MREQWGREGGRESDAERDGVCKKGRAGGVDTEREGVAREKERECIREGSLN